MNLIRESLLSIFRIGPGPSSSHVIGPMRAANDFRRRLNRLGALPDGAALTVHGYGSLALTGKGHGSDRAFAAGLLGEEPETCDTDRLATLFARPDERHEIAIGAGGALTLSPGNVVFHREPHSHPHPNTMVFRVTDPDGRVLLEETYYSTGGGDIRRAGEPDPDESGDAPPYRYRDWSTFVAMTEQNRISPEDALLANEMHTTGLSAGEVTAELDRRLERMRAVVASGLGKTGLLPGPLKVSRRAAEALAASRRAGDDGERFLLALDAYALAAAEENAAGARVVTAPTSGASGVVPAVVYHLGAGREVDEKSLRRGLWLAGVVGLTAKRNAGISGAEMGCQGEIGVAAAMAAALWAGAAGLPLPVVETAAETALEHHLGLICDPVEGYVQIPCIERNAIAAVTAANAFLLARARGRPGRVRLDEAVAAMREAGGKMSSEFRETARGGLATCALCQ